MGCSASVQVHAHTGTAAEPEAAATSVSARSRSRNKEIENELAKERKVENNIIKLLLLGGIESGKTTTFKQMKILHTSGFSEADLINFRYIIHANAIESLRQLLQAWGKLGTHLDGNLTIYVKQFLHFYGKSKAECYDFVLTPEIAHVMSLLWKNKAIQSCYAHRWDFNFLDSTKYFMDNLYRIAEPKYIPTEQDILHSRSGTQGIHEITFDYKDVSFRMVDVGGQKSERRKWIHIFDNTDMILFILALSDYDQKDPEDEDQNRMLKNMEIYQYIASCEPLQNASMTVFLNKKDVFEQKLKHTPLTACFNDYTGEGKTVDEAITFVSEKLKSLTPKDKNFYPFRTQATDTDNVSKIFASCLSDLVEKSLAL